MDSIELLKKRIQTLAPIVAGLQQALANLDLDDTERLVLKSIVNRYASEYAEARKKVKQARKQADPIASKKKQEKRVKAKAVAKSVDKIELSYKKQRDKKIEETHKISGFNRKWISVVQGGSPGLGKKS